MINFLKNFGKGILYVLVLPFLLIGLALYAVVALFVFIFLAIKGLVLFFSGRSLYEDLPEDKEAKRRLNAMNKPEPQPASEGTFVASSIVDNNNVSNDPFYVPEYLKTEEQKEELSDEEKPTELETFINENRNELMEEELKENTPKEVISNEKSTQNTTILDINDIDDDDDDKGSGVNIDFD